MALWLSSSWRIGVPKWSRCRFAYYIRQITSRQSNSAGCGILHANVVVFSMMPVLMATRVPLPIKAFPWHLTMKYVKSIEQLCRYASWYHDNSSWQHGVPQQFQYENVRNNHVCFMAAVDYVTTIAASCHCGITSCHQCVPKVQQIASSQSELPLSPSRHHSYQNGMSAFASVSNVVSRASQVMDYVNEIKGRSVLAVVAMKVIHSGSQFRFVAQERPESVMNDNYRYENNEMHCYSSSITFYNMAVSYQFYGINHDQYLQMIAIITRPEAPPNFSCLDLYVQKCRELGSGVQPQATPQA
ncbi:hypothetical protein T10_10828 [Trichinella papuae]|uniref:Uncharacterized protein n=1 Tax=Trichinella papuae TaxID=268474 RepID=A0A0V1MGB9_9BILA|nr:hypothetical protein T10_10828 [Trichinella papuae]